MKKTSCINLFITSIVFLSGCSQGYRSNAYHEQLAYQQRVIAQQQYHKQQQSQARTHTKKARHASYQKRPKAIYRPRLAPESSRASQQALLNAKTEQQQARQLISHIAHSTIGAPYKWGGNNPQQGFDCSGLMSYVHKNALGINIPRTAAQQRNKSRTISYEQLQPGDMLFFRTGRNSNHVGVYIGNRKFVHAATGSKHVKVASMDSAYWHKRFVKFGTFL